MARVYTLINNSTVIPDNDVTSGLLTNESLFGTLGTDVYFGYTGNDILNGNDGDDFLLGEVGNDTLNGGDGDDFLFHADNNYFNSGYSLNFVGAGSQIANELDRQFLEDEWYDVFNVQQLADPGADLSISGGDGFDTGVIDLSFSSSPLTFSFTAENSFSLPNGTTDVSGIEAIWLRGGSGNDNFTGGANDDRLYGGDGNDVLNGGKGKDFLFGGNGEDDLRGGEGNDFIVSTNYFAQFSRGGNQLALDYITGLAPIYAGTSVSVSAQQDTLIDGGLGTDTAVIDFEANSAAVNFELIAGEVQTLPEINTQVRDVEVLWVIDSAFNDIITGGDFDDRFLSVGGEDVFDGSNGDDTYELITSAGDANVNLTSNVHSGIAQGDTLISIENVVGSNGVNVLTGNEKDNELFGRDGDDTLNGSSGNDILDGGNGRDTLNGGSGIDTASYASSVSRVTVDLINDGNAGVNTGDAAGDDYISIENIIGTRRGDILLGDNLSNRIDGGLGRDNIQGRGGNDTFIASANNDSFSGGDGEDTLILSGKRSDYVIVATGSGFSITDKRGASADGTDTVASVEKFTFSDQTRTAATLLNVAPVGLAFSQFGSLPEDSSGGTIVGTLSATDSDGDTVSFSLDSAGSALFTLVGNQLRLKSGANIDFDASTGGSPTRTFEVTATDGKGGTTTVSFELEIANSTADDIIRGDGGNNRLVGTAGNDHIQGLGGNDILIGGKGADKLEGGSGIDAASYANATGAVGASLRNPSSNTGDAAGDTYSSIERLIGSSFSDRLEGNSAANRLIGDKGNDRLYGDGGGDVLIGGIGADKLYGGSGLDTASYEGATRAVGASLWNPSSNTGDAKGDTFSSIENLTGSSFSDRLEGNTVANILKGGGGNDRIYGGSGADKLYGGSGADTFIYKTVSQSTMTTRDMIYDFSRSQADKINLSAIDASTKRGGDQAFTFIGEQGFHNKAGELRYVNTKGDTYVYGDVNGDGKTDFSIQLDKTIELTKGDFIL